MKKMLVFREGSCPEPHEIDDLLYNTEVIRQDFVDMTPDDETRRYSGTLGVYDSTWQIVFKDSDKYDYWHILAVGTEGYAFEEPSFKAASGLLEPYRSEYLVLQAVIHKTNTMLLIYRVNKALSMLLHLHLPKILYSLQDGIYHYAVPDDALGPVNAALAKKEDVKDAQDGGA